MLRFPRWTFMSTPAFLSLFVCMGLGVAISSGAPTASTIDNPSPSTPPGFINVKEAPYNAVGDGECDDTQALQDALNDAADLSVGVYMPGGHYRITKGLDFFYSTQLTLIGNGPTSTFIEPDFNDSKDYVLDIHPGDTSAGDTVVAALLEHFRIQWKDYLIGSGSVGPQVPTMSNGIRLSGVSGSTLINNVKMKNGPLVLLHLQSGNVQGYNYYPFLEHFTVENSAFLGRVASNGAGTIPKPLILASGTHKILQVRFQRNLVGAEGQARNHIRIENGEQWTISDNKFRNINHATSIHIGGGDSAPVGFRIYSNGFENIQRGGDPASKDRAIIYLQGRISDNDSEHPFIGYNTFIHPSIRDIYLENISHALVVEQGITQDQVHLVGDFGQCRDNKIMAMGGNFSDTNYENSFLYSSNYGMAATSGFSAFRNKSIDSNRAGDRRPFFEWGVVQGKTKLSPHAITELVAGDEKGLLGLPHSELETRVDGDLALTLRPGRALVESLGVANSEECQGPVPSDAAHAIQVFDKDGHSLGYIPVYANKW